MRLGTTAPTGLFRRSLRCTLRLEKGRQSAAFLSEPARSWSRKAQGGVAKVQQVCKGLPVRPTITFQGVENGATRCNPHLGSERPFFPDGLRLGYCQPLARTTDELTLCPFRRSR